MLNNQNDDRQGKSMVFDQLSVSSEDGTPTRTASGDWQKIDERRDWWAALTQHLLHVLHMHFVNASTLSGFIQDVIIQLILYEKDKMNILLHLKLLISVLGHTSEM